MITEYLFWIVRDAAGREAFPTGRMTPDARKSYEASGHTIHGPVEVLLPAPKPIQSVDLSETGGES